MNETLQDASENFNKALKDFILVVKEELEIIKFIYKVLNWLERKLEK